MELTPEQISQIVSALRPIITTELQSQTQSTQTQSTQTPTQVSTQTPTQLPTQVSDGKINIEDSAILKTISAELQALKESRIAEVVKARKEELSEVVEKYNIPKIFLENVNYEDDSKWEEFISGIKELEIPETQTSEENQESQTSEENQESQTSEENQESQTSEENTQTSEVQKTKPPIPNGGTTRVVKSEIEQEVEEQSSIVMTMF